VDLGGEPWIWRLLVQSWFRGGLHVEVGAERRSSIFPISRVKSTGFVS
jgi:hypothetical protein